MSKLTDTQLVILSSALRRNDRGVDLPANVTGEAVGKAVDKLIRAGLLEEVRANGSLLAWRRDAEVAPVPRSASQIRLSHYPVSPKPAITLSRKDWHSSANGAVV
jgi:hypothetical protein